MDAFHEYLALIHPEVSQNAAAGSLPVRMNPFDEYLALMYLETFQDAPLNEVVPTGNPVLERLQKAAAYYLEWILENHR